MDARSIVNRAQRRAAQRGAGGGRVRRHATGHSRARIAGRLLALAAGSRRRARSRRSTQQLQRFLAAARKRPELAGVTSPFSANVPQVFADVDREKVAAPGRGARRRLPDDAGVPRRAVRQPVQPLRPAVARVPPGRGRQRAAPRPGRQFYVRNDAGTMVPLSTVQSLARTFGPQFTNRFNVYRAVQVTGAAAPGYSSGQAMAALEEVARADAAADVQLRLGRPVVPGEARRGQHERRRSCCRCSSCS